jgi:hypothetical protein
VVGLTVGLTVGLPVRPHNQVSTYCGQLGQLQWCTVDLLEHQAHPSTTAGPEGVHTGNHTTPENARHLHKMQAGSGGFACHEHCSGFT